LLTVVFATAGAENGIADAAFTVSPINVVGTRPTSSISRVLLDESALSRKPADSATIDASRSCGSAEFVSSVCNLPNNRLPPLPCSLESRIDAGQAATSVSSGNSPWPSRYRRRVPPTYATATSLIVAFGTLALIRWKSARSWKRASNTRCGEAEPLNRVVGAKIDPDPGPSAEAIPPANLPGRLVNWPTALSALGITTLLARNG
jgi:hypothetical protein